MARAKLSITPKATVAATVEVKLSPAARKMLVQRGAEHAQLSAQVRDIKGTKKKPGRMKRIEAEVDAIFTKEKQGGALLDGTEVAGYGFKSVYGKRSVFDKTGFMKKHGLTVADFEEFTTIADNEPYIKITAPGQSEDDE